jgi:hypothetical protein
MPYDSVHVVAGLFMGGDSMVKAAGKRQGIPSKVQNLVWARAAGRCEYRGCNQSLIGDALSDAPNANKAYLAHIVGDTAGGPRGDDVLSPQLSKDPNNIMLVCDAHHRVIDREKQDEHDVEVLRAMKREHETRIATVTAIIQSRGTNALRYAARIGTNESPLTTEELKRAILSEGRFPIPGGDIDLDIVGLDIGDHEPEYWKTHVRNLRSGFNERIKGRMERGEIQHLTAAGLAPIPLLIELGRLLSDIRAVDVRQMLRNPKGLVWANDVDPLNFEIKGAETSRTKNVALKLEISAQVRDDRVHAAIGPGVPIWSITSSEIGNDVIRRPEDLAEFAKVFRSSLDLIKLGHGEDVEVHLFPVIPVSAAIEAGRGWQPKAHPILHVYDHNKLTGGSMLVHSLDQRELVRL